MTLLYTFSHGLADDIISLDSRGFAAGECTLARHLKPGDWVKHRWTPVHQGLGMLVAVGKCYDKLQKETDFVTVLWSVEPNYAGTPVKFPVGTSIVYAPYIPLVTTPVALEPEEVSFKVLKNRQSSLKAQFYPIIKLDDP